MVTYNFYTGHNLGEHLRRLKDNNIILFGTVRLNKLDGQNSRNIREAQALLKNAERGKWYLCQAYHTAARSSRGVSA